MNASGDLNINNDHQMSGEMLKHLQGLLSEVRAILSITKMVIL